LGGAYSPQKNTTKPMCGCTELTHEDVRKAIREEKLLSIPETMEFLNWKAPNGCASCRPALNYYLISSWPHEAKDDPQSRFINERSHANIQKDGTYSVIPRMAGGVTGAATRCSPTWSKSTTFPPSKRQAASASPAWRKRRTCPRCGRISTCLRYAR
jgi:NAD(P)H-nitrite reductase large subunit